MKPNNKQEKSLNAPFAQSTATGKEDFMAAISKISVRRKRDNLYVHLTGNFNETSADSLMYALKRMVMTALKYTPTGTEVVFAFRTHCKVDLADRDSLEDY